MAFNLDAALRLFVDVKGENNIRRFGLSLEGLQGQVKNTAASLISLNGALAAIGGGAVLSKIFGDTATLQAQTKSIEVLTGSAEKAAEIVQQLRVFAGATPFESVELIETAKRLNAFGVEADKVVETTRRLGDVAGATGANLGELATAYGQVVAKGRLQGEELLQFQERGVALADELRKMYNLSREDFTKALESGRISAEAVTVALQRLTDQGGKYAGGAIAQSDTLNGKLSTLLDGVTSLSQALGQVLEPAFKAVLNVAISAVGAVESAIRSLVTGFQNAYRESDLFRGVLNGLIGALTTIAALQVFSAFIAGARAAITITGTLIKALKALTAANLLAGIAGFFKSKPGLIAALVAGLGVGIDAAFNDGQLVKAIASGLDRALSSVFDNLGASVPSLAGLPQLGTAGAVPDLLAERGAAERAEREREQARRKAEADAKRAATLQERRNALERKGAETLQSLRDRVNGLSQAYAGVGATGVDALQNKLGEALMGNSKTVRALTLDYVEFVREVQKLGGEVTPELTAQFRELINQVGQGGEKLANAEFVQGLKELLPALSDYKQQIAELQQLEENRKAGIEGLTELQRLNMQIQMLGLDVLAQTNEELRKYIEQLREAAGQVDKLGQKGTATFGENFKKAFQDAYKSAIDLGTQLGGTLVSGIDGLTSAIVEFAATGKAAFKELAASILKDLGAIFIKAALFKAIGAAFPGLKIGMAATGGTTGPLSTVPVKQYATGGIAKSPQMSIYGERGPEAFVPLPDGRSIPVKLRGNARSDALNRYQPVPGSSQVGPDGQPMAAGDAAAGGGIIDVRYTVERINNVEYVTAEQFRSGMRQAAKEGAARGEQQTLRRLQTSASTRKRVGV